MKFLVLVLAGLLFVSLTVAGEQKVWLENRELVVSEVKERMRIPDVPEGLSAEIAYKLVTGELKESTIKGEKEKKVYYFFSFPLRKKTLFLDRIVSYSQGRWLVNEVMITGETVNWFITVLWLIVPGLGILTAGVVNQLAGARKRRLVVFYISLLLAIVLGAGIGGLTNSVAGGFVVGLFTGGFAGGFAGVFVGALAGAFAGMCAGGFAGEQGYEIVVFYLLFLVAITGVSFLLALLTGFIKKHYPWIKGVVDWIAAD